MYDLLIKNCQVNGVAADIAVANGKIAAIGSINDAAAETFDASNMAALPPFYNTHISTHSKKALNEPFRAFLFNY